MLRGRQVTGLVRDDAGQPVVGAGVDLLGVEDVVALTLFESTITDRNGEFCFALGACDHVILVRPPETRPGERRYHESYLTRAIVTGRNATLHLTFTRQRR